MLAGDDEAYDFVEQRAVFCVAFFGGHELGVLLYAPCRPQRHIGLLHLVYVHGEGAAAHEVAYAFRKGLHVGFKELCLANVQCKPRHCYEHIPCAAFEPRPSCDYVVFAVFLDLELVGGVYEALVEVANSFVLVNLLVHLLFHLGGAHLAQPGAEHNLFALAYVNLEIARDHKVFVCLVAAFAFARIVKAEIPLRVVNKLALFVELHIQVGVAVVKAHPYAVGYRGVVKVCRPVFVGELIGAAECEKRLEAQLCL